jgi:hypothetical protein
MSGPCSKVIIKINDTLEIQNFDFFTQLVCPKKKKTKLLAVAA